MRKDSPDSVKKNFRFTWAIKIAILFSLSTIISLGLYGVYVGFKFQENKIKQVHYIRNLFGSSVGQSVKDLLNSYKAAILNTSQQMESHGFSAKSKVLLSSQFETLSDLSRVAVFNPKGRLLFNWQRPKEGRSNAKEENFSKFTEELKNFPVGELRFMISEPSNPGISYIIRSPSLLINFNFSGTALVDRLSQIPGGNVAFVDLQSGMYVADRARFKGKRFDLDHPIITASRETPAGEGSMEYTSESGAEYLGGFHKLSPRLALIVSVSKDKALGKNDEMYIDFTLLAVILASLAIIISMLFIRKMSGSFGKLRRLVEEISAGNFFSNEGVNSSDELGELSKQFRRLSLQLSAKQMEIEKVNIEISKDFLSGLKNRKYFDDHAPRAFELAKQNNRDLSILMIELDFFDQISDSYGTDQSSEVIKVVGKTIDDILPITNFAARYSAKQFFIVMPETNLEKAMEQAEKIREVVAYLNIGVLDKEKLSMSTTTSIGIANLASNELENLDQAIKCAAKALNEAKHSGGDRSYSFQGKFSRSKVA